MKQILLTGGSGFIGRNILPILQEMYQLYAPNRNELDLRNERAVMDYLRMHHFDAVLHLANPNPVKSSDSDHSENMLQDSLKIFLNFTRASDLYGKLVYMGSGAEFDKRMDISSIVETDFGRSIPEDIYGFSKYIMNEITLRSVNIFNMRIFACYGPYDHESKFIRHAINCCMREVPITIRKNCIFDYMYVTDIVQCIKYFVDGSPGYQDYNCCTGKKYSLLEIAQEVRTLMDSQQDITILSEGWLPEYTGSNARLVDEMPDGFHTTSLREGILNQIEWQRGCTK